MTDVSLGVAVAGGAIVAIVSVVAWVRWADRTFDARAREIEPLFPSQPNVRDKS
jgi:hypothetical protein